MNLKKIRILATLLCTTCLGSLYGDVYDVTNSEDFQNWLKAYFNIEEASLSPYTPSELTLPDKDINYLNATISYIFPQKLLNQPTAYNAITTIAKDETFVSGDKYEDDLPGNLQSIFNSLKEELENVNDQLANQEGKIKPFNLQQVITYVLWRLSRQELITYEKFCVYLNELKTTYANKNIKIFGRKLDSIPSDRDEYKAQYFRDKVSVQSNNNPYKINNKLAGSELEKLFRNFVTSALPRLLAKRFPPITTKESPFAQPGCAMYVSNDGSIRFYISEKLTREQAPSNKPTGGNYSSLFTYDDCMHTERQLVIAALRNNFNYQEKNWNEPKRYTPEQKQLNSEDAKKVTNAAQGQLYVFTLSSPCYTPSPTNVGYPCAHWWKALKEQANNLKINLYYSTFYHEKPITEYHKPMWDNLTPSFDTIINELRQNLRINDIQDKAKALLLPFDLSDGLVGDFISSVLKNGGITDYTQRIEKEDWPNQTKEDVRAKHYQKEKWPEVYQKIKLAILNQYAVQKGQSEEVKQSCNFNELWNIQEIPEFWVLYLTEQLLDNNTPEKQQMAMIKALKGSYEKANKRFPNQFKYAESVPNLPTDSITEKDKKLLKGTQQQCTDINRETMSE